MPEGSQDRRRSRSEKPPTALMQSYKSMPAKKKLELKRIGYVLLMFCLVVPIVATVALSAFSEASLPVVLWLFCGVGMTIGVCLAWPEMGIYLLSRLPAAVGKLLPSKLSSAIDRPERRN